jgi:GMP synthase (glutamine-hydrolysing)
VKNIQETVGDEQVILGLSGGVDSSVAAALINKAIGHQLTAILVDTGLLRLNEAHKVMETYQTNFDLQIKKVDASEEFYQALKGITDPETKRKTIGKLFVDVFAREAKSFKNAKFLAQGTIYPDVIESATEASSAKVIKSHHNVGGLPEDLKFELLEPLRYLFKDEVREVGRELGIPEQMINRHPFPGPGLGIRIIGEVNQEKADILRQVDDIFISLLEENNLYNQVSQAHVVLLPVKTVGVMGDNRTYAYVVALRSVNTIDFMTANITHFK